MEMTYRQMTTSEIYGAATGDLLRAQARLIGIKDPVTVVVAGLITKAVSLLDGASTVNSDDVEQINGGSK